MEDIINMTFENKLVMTINKDTDIGTLNAWVLTSGQISLGLAEDKNDSSNFC